MLLSSRVRVLAGLLLCGGAEALGAAHIEAYAGTQGLSHVFKGSVRKQCTCRSVVYTMRQEACCAVSVFHTVSSSSPGEQSTWLS